MATFHQLNLIVRWMTELEADFITALSVVISSNRVTNVILRSVSEAVDSPCAALKCGCLLGLNNKDYFLLGQKFRFSWTPTTKDYTIFFKIILFGSEKDFSMFHLIRKVFFTRKSYYCNNSWKLCNLMKLWKLWILILFLENSGIKCKTLPIYDSLASILQTILAILTI